MNSHLLLSTRPSTGIARAADFDGELDTYKIAISMNNCICGCMQECIQIMAWEGAQICQVAGDYDHRFPC